MGRNALRIDRNNGQPIAVNEPLVYLTVESKATRGRNRSSSVLGGQSDDSKQLNSATVNTAILSDRVIKLKVTANSKRVAEAEITFWNEDLALLDHPVMQKGTILQISWGYSGYMSKKRKFKVQKVKGSTARVAAWGQLKIICYDQTFDFHGRAKSRCFHATKRSSIVRKIAREYGIPVSDQIIGIDQIDLNVDTYFQSNETDAQFIKELAQELDWVFKVQDGILMFAPPSMLSLKQPIASYVYFTDDEGWIKRFEPTTSIAAIPGSVTVKSRDPKTGKKVQSTATLQNRKKKSLCLYTETRPGETSGSAIQLTAKKIHRSKAPLKAGVVPSSVVVNSPGLTARQAKTEARTRLSKYLRQAVKSRMDVIGDPDLWDSLLVNVENVGKAMSGLHRIQECTHTVDSSGYDVSMKLRREGVGTLGKNNKGFADQKARAQLVSRRLRGRVSVREKVTNVNVTGVAARRRFSRI